MKKTFFFLLSFLFMGMTVNSLQAATSKVTAGAEPQQQFITKCYDAFNNLQGTTIFTVKEIQEDHASTTYTIGYDVRDEVNIQSLILREERQ